MTLNGSAVCGGSAWSSFAETEGGGGNGDLLIAKVSSSGAVEWIQQFGNTTKASGGSTSGYEECITVAVDASDNIYCSGISDGSFAETNGGGGNNDLIIVRLGPSGQFSN